MKKHLSIAITTILVLFFQSGAQAQFVVSTQIGGVPTVNGAYLETFDEITPPILTLSGNAVLLTGNIPLVTAPPYFSGSTAAYFGESPANGYDNSQYVAAEVGGSATLNFSTPQTYLGLLWGSIDQGNTLAFYGSANNLIGTVTGFQLGAPHDGDGSDASGTPYVNIISSIPFTSVVATSSINSFEFDDVAYAQPAPEPAGVALLLFGLSGITLLRRRQRSPCRKSDRLSRFLSFAPVACGCYHRSCSRQN